MKNPKTLAEVTPPPDADAVRRLLGLLSMPQGGDDALAGAA